MRRTISTLLVFAIAGCGAATAPPAAPADNELEAAVFEHEPGLASAEAEWGARAVEWLAWLRHHHWVERLRSPECAPASGEPAAHNNDIIGELQTTGSPSPACRRAERVLEAVAAIRDRLERSPRTDPTPVHRVIAEWYGTPACETVTRWTAAERRAVQHLVELDAYVPTTSCSPVVSIAGPVDVSAIRVSGSRPWEPDPACDDPSYDCLRRWPDDPAPGFEGPLMQVDVVFTGLHAARFQSVLLAAHGEDWRVVQTGHAGQACF